MCKMDSGLYVDSRCGYGTKNLSFLHLMWVYRRKQVNSYILWNDRETNT